MTGNLLIGLLLFTAALSVFGGVASVLLIGKPKKPTTPGVALAVLVLNGLAAWACIWAAVALR